MEKININPGQLSTSDPIPQGRVNEDIIKLSTGSQDNSIMIQSTDLYHALESTDNGGKKMSCQCTKTKCINGYCSCFKNKLKCGIQCNCKHCGNKENSLTQSYKLDVLGSTNRINIWKPQVQQSSIQKIESKAISLRQGMRQEKIERHRSRIRNTFQLNIMSLNVRSIHSQIKKDEFFKFIKKQKDYMEYIGLTETHLKLPFRWGQKPVFQSKFDDRGGVAFTTSNKQCSKVTHFQNSIVWSKVIIHKTPVHIITVYIEPSDNEEAQKTINMLQYYLKERIFGQYKKSRIVIMGDFNRAHMQKIKNIMSYNKLTQVFMDDESTHQKGGQLDQIFTNLEVKFKKIINTPSTLSDHYALYTQLQMTINEDDLNIEKLPTIITQKDIKNSLRTPEMLDKMRNDINFFKKQAKDDPDAKPKETQTIKRWYQPPPTWYQYKGQGSKSWQMAKQQEWKMLINKIERYRQEKKIKECFQLIKKATQIKNNQCLLQGIIKEQQHIYDSTIKTVEVLSYFQQLYGMEQSENKDIQEWEMNDNIGEILFTKMDIDEAIGQVDFSKGVGPDGFNGEILKDKLIKENLMQFIYQCLNKQEFPQYIQNGRLILFTKNGKDSCAINESRPIVVLSHIRKIIERTILNKIKQTQSSLLEVKRYQTGFKEGHNTHLNLTQILMLIKSTRQKKSSRKAFFFLDLKKAYDSVNREKLFNILYSRCNGTQDKTIVNCIRKLFTVNKLIYENEEIEVLKGVFQGSILSPFLFNVYLEDAIESSQTLKNMALHGRLYAFADDILLITEDPNYSKKAITEMEKLSKSHNLHLNKQKSQLLSDSAKFQKIQEICGIQKVNKVKYLGLQISLNIPQIIKNAKQCMQKYLYQLKTRIKTQSQDVSKLLFTAYLKSLMLYHLTPLYAAGILKENQITSFEQSTIRQFLGYPNDIRKDMVINICVSQQTRIVELIQNKTQAILNKISTQRQMDEINKEKQKMDINMLQKMKEIHKTKKIYVSKEVQDLMVSISANRTLPGFYQRHYCLLHKVIITPEHIQYCSLLNENGPIKKFKELVEQQSLRYMDERKLAETLIYFDWLQNKIKILEANNLVQRITVNPIFKTSYIKKGQVKKYIAKSTQNTLCVNEEEFQGKMEE